MPNHFARVTELLSIRTVAVGQQVTRSSVPGKASTQLIGWLSATREFDVLTTRSPCLGLPHSREYYAAAGFCTRSE